MTMTSLCGLAQCEYQKIMSEPEIGFDACVASTFMEFFKFSHEALFIEKME
jgi:hypothetical protein